jgi:hypothetical protein
MSNRYLLGRIVERTGRIVRPFLRTTIPFVDPYSRVYKETGKKQNNVAAIYFYGDRQRVASEEARH